MGDGYESLMIPIYGVLDPDGDGESPL